MSRTSAVPTVAALVAVAVGTPAMAGDGVVTIRDIVVGGYMSMAVLACSCLVPMLALGLTLEGRLSLAGRFGVAGTGVAYGVLSSWYVAATRPTLVGTVAVMAVGIGTAVVLAVLSDGRTAAPWRPEAPRGTTPAE